MTTYVHPERVQRGQLLWLEIEELRLKVACRVNALSEVVPSRAEVEILASDHTLVWVDFNRLFEEST